MLRAMVKKTASALKPPVAKRTAPAKHAATGSTISAKAPARRQVASAGRANGLKASSGPLGHTAALPGQEFGDVEPTAVRIAARGQRPDVTGLPAGLRAAIEQMTEQAFARSPFAANEARLRSQVRLLQRQVTEQAREIQALKARSEAVVPAVTPADVATPGSSRANQALDALRTRLADQAPMTAQRSEDARRRWVVDGVIIPTATLVDAWGVSRQALDQARERGDLVGLKVANRQYYPASVLGLSSESVAQICRALAGMDPVSAVLFWTREHGAFDGLTVSEAVTTQGLDAVVQAAEAFAAELAGVHVA